MATQLSRTGQHVSSPICHNAGHQFVTMLVTSAMRFEEAPDVMTPLRYVWPGGKIYPAFEAVGAREPCLGVVEGMPEELARRGPKMAPRQPQDGPRWPQDDFRTAPRWPQNGRSEFVPLREAQQGPKMAPRRLQDGPRWPQDGLRTAPRWPKTAEDSPKTASKRPQDDPKTAEDGLKTAEDGPRSPKIGARWAAVRHGCAEAHGGEPKRI